MINREIFTKRKLAVLTRPLAVFCLFFVLANRTFKGHGMLISDKITILILVTAIICLSINSNFKAKALGENSNYRDSNATPLILCVLTSLLLMIWFFLNKM